MIGLEAHYDIFDLGLKSSLDKLARATGKTVGRIIKDRTPTLARYLAEATQPVANMDSAPDGKSMAARDMGRAAVRRDIRRVYLPSSTIYNELKGKAAMSPGNQGGQVARSAGAQLARAWYGKLKKGDLEGARKIMQAAGLNAQTRPVTPWDGGARHDQARNKRGRVNSGFRPVIVDDYKAVKKYIREKELRVGYAKSGWYNAGKQVKSGGAVSAWIRNNAGPGSGHDLTSDTDNPRVLITNHVRYIDQIMTEGIRIRAVSAFEASLHKEIFHALDYLARKEAARANAATTAAGMAAAA